MVLLDNEPADAFINTLMIGIDNLAKDTETKRGCVVIKVYGAASHAVHQPLQQRRPYPRHPVSRCLQRSQRLPQG